MKVRELKKVLEGIDDDLNVIISVSSLVKPGPEPYLYTVKSAEYVAPWGLGGHEFQIYTDEGFDL